MNPIKRPRWLKGTAQTASQAAICFAFSTRIGIIPRSSARPRRWMAWREARSSHASGSSGLTTSTGAGCRVLPATVYSEAPFGARKSVTGSTPVIAAARAGMRRHTSLWVAVASSSCERPVHTISGSKREV